MIFEWEDNGKVFQKEIKPGDAIVGFGYDKLILTGEDLDKISELPDEKLAFYIRHLATRSYF
jgi:hypothetical protein